MINVHKKSFDEGTFEKELKIERRRTDQKMVWHKQKKQTCFLITENEETMFEKELVFTKSKSYFEMTTLTLKRQYRSVYERRQPQQHFKNLFPGCRDWPISSANLPTRNSLNSNLSQSLQQRDAFSTTIDSQRVENFPQSQSQQMRNSQIDYDQSEWFDTDCSEYESEIAVEED